MKYLGLLIIELWRHLEIIQKGDTYIKDTFRRLLQKTWHIEKLLNLRLHIFEQHGQHELQ